MRTFWCIQVSLLSHKVLRKKIFSPELDLEGVDLNLRRSTSRGWRSTSQVEKIWPPKNAPKSMGVISYCSHSHYTLILHVLEFFNKNPHTKFVWGGKKIEFFSLPLSFIFAMHAGEMHYKRIFFFFVWENQFFFYVSRWNRKKIGFPIQKKNCL
jgi:hypothetical protein